MKVQDLINKVRDIAINYKTYYSQTTKRLNVAANRLGANNKKRRYN